jgi:hypothetical protein
MPRNQQIAIALVVVALVCLVVFITNFGPQVVGNRRALLATAIGGTCTTIAAWLWARGPRAA